MLVLVGLFEEDFIVIDESKFIDNVWRGVEVFFFIIILFRFWVIMLVIIMNVLI